MATKWDNTFEFGCEIDHHGLIRASLPHVDTEAGLITAVKCGNLFAVEELLDRGADPEAKDNDAQTALMWAAGYGQREMVALLLDRGADPNAEGADGWTALTIAVANCHVETAALLGKHLAEHPVS